MPNLSSSLPILTAVLAAGVLLLGVLVFRLMAWKKYMENKWLNLMTGSDSESLQELLVRHLSERAEVKADIASLMQRLEKLDLQIAAAKRFLGFVRYDAFPEVTGQQSFSLAIYDDHGDGVVITSQVGRSDARVFSKKLEGGEADRTLTEEEKQAINTAARSINLKGGK